MLDAALILEDTDCGIGLDVPGGAGIVSGGDSVIRSSAVGGVFPVQLLYFVVICDSKENLRRVLPSEDSLPSYKIISEKLPLVPRSCLATEE